MLHCYFILYRLNYDLYLFLIHIYYIFIFIYYTTFLTYIFVIYILLIYTWNIFILFWCQYVILVSFLKFWEIICIIYILIIYILKRREREKNELKIKRRKEWKLGSVKNRLFEYGLISQDSASLLMHGNRDLADGLMHIVITRSALLAVTLGRDTGQLASQSQEEAVLTSAFPV